MAAKGTRSGAPLGAGMQEEQLVQAVIQERFEDAISRVRACKQNGIAVNTQDQLALYGLYKQAFSGDIYSQRPGFFDPTGRAKWASWKSYEGLDSIQAMERYQNLADVLCPSPLFSPPARAPVAEENTTDISTSTEISSGNSSRSGGSGADEQQHPERLNSNPIPKNPAIIDKTVNELRGDGGAQAAGKFPKSSIVPSSGHASRGPATGETKRAAEVNHHHGSVSGGRRGKNPGYLLRETNHSGGRTGTSSAISAPSSFGVHNIWVWSPAVLGVTVTLIALRARRSLQSAEEAYAYSVGPFFLFSVLWLVVGSSVCGLWFAVRLARWREEIFAGSPIVPEALSRAAALDGESGCGVIVKGRQEEGTSTDESIGACLHHRMSTDFSSSGDPVGDLFRPGTKAALDFCAPGVMSSCVDDGGGDGSFMATAESDGAVVFMTGVTGLVGQMVLFDLLKQGAASSSKAAVGMTERWGDDGDREERSQRATSAGESKLRRVIVLVRDKKGASAEDRLSAIKNSPMFHPLRQSGAWIDEDESEAEEVGSCSSSEKVAVLAGADHHANNVGVSSPFEDDSGDDKRKTAAAVVAQKPSTSSDLPFSCSWKPKKRGFGATVTVAEGELGEEGLGLSAESRLLLAGVGVTHALHCAASVSFSDPLAEATATNVTGALRVASLVASWPSCGTLVHVSTAFVHGSNSGTPSSPLPQQLPNLGGRNPERLYRSAQNAPSDLTRPNHNVTNVYSSQLGPGKEAMSAMTELGYPNTYTFTKAIGEHLLVRALRAHNKKLLVKTPQEGFDENDIVVAEKSPAEGRGRRRRLKLRIMRPSIVGPSWVFPWPGWASEQPSTVTGCQVLVLQRAVKTFRLGPHPAPIIPVDVVSRAIVLAAMGWGSGSPLNAPAGADTNTTIKAATVGLSKTAAVTPTPQQEGMFPSAQPQEREAAAITDDGDFEGLSTGKKGEEPCLSDLGESKFTGNGLAGRTSELNSNSSSCRQVPRPNNGSYSNSSFVPVDFTLRFSSSSNSTGEAVCGFPHTAEGDVGRSGGERKAADRGSNYSSKDDVDFCPEVVIRNLAWATHPIRNRNRRMGNGNCHQCCKIGTIAPAGQSGTITTRGSNAVAASAVLHCSARVECGNDNKRGDDVTITADDEREEGEEEGSRMPSFREISGLLYDYAVLRGLRPSFEALAMRASFAVASMSPIPSHTENAYNGRGDDDDYVPLPCLIQSKPQDGSLLLSPSPVVGSRGGANHPIPPPRNDHSKGEMAVMEEESLPFRAPPLSKSRVFEVIHLLLDTAPVWTLRSIIALVTAGRMTGFGSVTSNKNGSDNVRRPGGNELSHAEEPGLGRTREKKGKGGGGLAATARRMDRLAELPSVYEVFTWRQYFFDSTLRVPQGLTPAGYALETALTSELLQRGLPGGDDAGTKASPHRRRSILRELSLQIQTHRSGGLRCGESDSCSFLSKLSSDVPSERDVMNASSRDNGGYDYKQEKGEGIEASYFLRSKTTGDSNSECNSGLNFEKLSPIENKKRQVNSRRFRTNSNYSSTSGNSSGLSFLCRGGDRLIPWPALAWWAATLPGSAARGGVTIWVRIVAFGVRVVMCRAASVVAVDVASFRAAAPPGFREENKEGFIRVGYGKSNCTGTGGDRQDAEEDDRNLTSLQENSSSSGNGSSSGGKGGLNNHSKSSIGGGRGGGGDGEYSYKNCAKEEVIHSAPFCGSNRSNKEAVFQQHYHHHQHQHHQVDSGREDVVVVLLPTHRSYLDFVLVSLLCAAMRSLPGLSWLRVPKVAAADGPFGQENSPLRLIMEKLGAFFVRRGKNEPHSVLQRRLSCLRDDGQEHSSELSRGRSRKLSSSEPCRKYSAFSSRKTNSGQTNHNGDGSNNSYGTAAALSEKAGNGFGATTRHEDSIGQTGVGSERVSMRKGGIGGICSNEDGERRQRGGGERWPGPCEYDPFQRGLETIEVFVEGRRSRDRRFLAPKTGVLRALQAAREGSSLWLVPVSISYERVPEQAQLSKELSAGAGKGQAVTAGLLGLLRWAMRALTGRVRLGKVLIRAGDPVILAPGGDVRAAVRQVRHCHRSGTVVTPYHLSEASRHLGLAAEDVQECLRELGGTVWEDGVCEDDATNPFDPSQTTTNTKALFTSVPGRSNDGRVNDSRLQEYRYYGSDIPTENRFAASPKAPSCEEESWMSHLQWLHLLEDEIRASRMPRWADWLVPALPPPSASITAAVSTSPVGGTREGGVGVSGDGGGGGAAAAAEGAYERESSSPMQRVNTGSAVTISGVASSTNGTAITTVSNSSLGEDPSVPDSSTTTTTAATTVGGGSAAAAIAVAASTPYGSNGSLCNGTISVAAATATSSTTSNSLAESIASSSSSSPSWVIDLASPANSQEKSQSSDEELLSQPACAKSHNKKERLASERVLEVVLREFERAERTITEARQALVHRGFSQPSSGHILQFLNNEREIWSGVEGDEEGGSRQKPLDGSGGDGGGTSFSSCCLFLASAALSLEEHHIIVANPENDPGSDPRSGTQNGDGSVAATVTRQEGERQLEDGDDSGDRCWFGVADGDKESVGSWGFQDSGFSLSSDKADGRDPYAVMRGNRYGICGKPLRGLLPFVREAVGVPIPTKGRTKTQTSTPPLPFLPPSRLLKPSDVNANSQQEEAVSVPGATGSVSGCNVERVPSSGGVCGASQGGDAARSNEVRGLGKGEGVSACCSSTLLESMAEALGPGFDTKGQVSVLRQERARHGTGHGLSDIWSLRSGDVKRAPDAVVWPTSEDQVSRLMEWAGKEGVCLIPFGGGTSVTRALEVPPLTVEPRPVVSVDMRKMGRVLSADLKNGTVHVEAGMVGRHLSSELAKRGVTVGHEPDSLEFSTVGGWVATRASGMKRGRYGNIEDIVLEVRVVTGRGVAWQHSDRAAKRGEDGLVGREVSAQPFSRSSVGLDLASAMLGSEGCLGIVTSVVLKVVKLPEVSEHASYVFRDFQTGVAFCRQLSLCSGRLGLASCRLLDNGQLRLGKALKGDEDQGAEGLRATARKLLPKAQVAYIRLVKGWEPLEMSAATIVFEGSRQEAALQRKEVSRIARCHGGVSGGASAGKSGYDLTFAIAYLRDFALTFDVLGESFETFVSWTALEGLCDRVRKRVRKEHRRRALRGDPFLTHRVTQLYPEGACVYFYLAIYAQGIREPTVAFSELEEAARDEILSAGGSLSHHHGIGKARAGFTARVSSPVVTELVLGMKRALDPQNVLGARNNVLAIPEQRCRQTP